MSKIYVFCKQNIGRGVWVRTLDGRLYKGKINKVTYENLYLAPLGHGVALENEKAIKGENLLSTPDVTKNGEEIFWGLIWLPILGIGAAGFLGGAIGGFLGARAGTRRVVYGPRYGYGSGYLGWPY